MRSATGCVALGAALLAAGCGGIQHHTVPNDFGPAKSRALTAWQAPADRTGFRVSTPSANYPLRTCVVSGAPLGPTPAPIHQRMDGPLSVTYDGTEIQLCCSACIREFRADPEKYVALVRAARG